MELDELELELDELMELEELVPELEELMELEPEETEELEVEADPELVLEDPEEVAVLELLEITIGSSSTSGSRRPAFLQDIVLLISDATKSIIMILQITR